MKYRARILNCASNSYKIIKLGKHMVYYQAEDKAIERCPEGWQVIQVWSYR